MSSAVFLFSPNFLWCVCLQSVPSFFARFFDPFIRLCCLVSLPAAVLCIVPTDLEIWNFLYCIVCLVCLPMFLHHSSNSHCHHGGQFVVGVNLIYTSHSDNNCSHNVTCFPACSHIVKLHLRHKRTDKRIDQESNLVHISVKMWHLAIF